MRGREGGGRRGREGGGDNGENSLGLNQPDLSPRHKGTNMTTVYGSRDMNVYQRIVYITLL